MTSPLSEAQPLQKRYRAVWAFTTSLGLIWAVALAAGLLMAVR